MILLIFCACIHIAGIHTIITALTYVCIISHQLNKNGKGLPLVCFKIFSHKLENHQIQLKPHWPLAKMCPLVMPTFCSGAQDLPGYT